MKPEPDELRPSNHAFQFVQADTDKMHIALAIPGTDIGFGTHDTVYVVLVADKATGDLTCALRSVIPKEFV